MFRNANINVAYLKKALSKSQPIFKPKSPRSSSQDWFLYKDDVAVYVDASVWDFICSEGVEMIWFPPYSSDIVPVRG
jgi:hypothetical protein